MRVDGEDVDQLERAEDVGGGEEALRDEVGVEGVPLVPGRQRRRPVPGPLLLLHLPKTHRGVTSSDMASLYVQVD